jgi:hypothetical protein
MPISTTPCFGPTTLLQVVLYMVPSLGAPRPVHLCGPPGDRGNSLAVNPQVELVEASSSLANIMALLHTRQLTGGKRKAHMGGCAVQ